MDTIILGVLTIFSQQARLGPLDDVTGRLLQFARRVMPRHAAYAASARKR
jgi:hypothetical protein